MTVSDMFLKRMLIGFILAVTVNTAAQTAAPPIYYNRAMTLPRGILTLRSYYIKPFFDSRYNPITGAMHDLPDNFSLNFSSACVFTSFGVTDGFSIAMNLPLNRRIIQNGGIEKTGFGFGDITLLLKQRLYQHRRSVLSFTLSPTFRTGKYKDIRATELPLGNGSNTLTLRLLADQRIGKIWLFGNLEYSLSDIALSGLNTNGSGYRLVLAGHLPITPQIRAELVGNYQTESSGSAGSDGSRDFHTLSTAAGLQYIFNQNFALQILLEKPLDQLNQYGQKWLIKTGFWMKL